MRIAAVIPARSGSERVRDKNITKLAGTPLIGIAARKALDIVEIDTVFPVTDSPEYMELFREYGVKSFPLRPRETSGSNSPDIEWLNWWLMQVGTDTFDVVLILRPTSPLRKRSTIVEGINALKNNWDRVDSVRCVSPVAEHPGKMWLENDGIMNPLLPFSINSTPWHSNQMKALPNIFIQNAMLEVIKVSSIVRSGTISGGVVMPLVRTGYETLDINQPIDFTFLEFLLGLNPSLVDW
jgi:CMP-N,N'-diacetyllegionaminic acid synthase